MIAVIAGTGALPLAACQNLLHNNERFFVISLFPEDNLAELQSVINNKREIVINPFYKLSTIQETLKQRQTQRLLFIGKVDKRNLFKKLKFDWLFFKFSSKLVFKGDKEIMELLVSFLKEQGIEVISQKDVLNSLMVPPGIITGTITQAIESDIKIGLSLAQEISYRDIGQTVVMKDGIILAVEAIEGTDECISRGVALGKDNVVICKAARPDQNKKYDLPTLGPTSLQNLLPGQVRAIAWQSNQTFIAQLDEFIKRAEALNITLVSL